MGMEHSPVGIVVDAHIWALLEVVAAVVVVVEVEMVVVVVSMEEPAEMAPREHGAVVSDHSLEWASAK